MIPDSAPATIPLARLTTLWFQIAGTRCNLQCTHCFISCGPDNHRLDFMSRELVHGYLNEASSLGVTEFYLTGGEPFLHRELPEIAGDMMGVGNVTILTNATLITPAMAEQLGDMANASANTLSFRVSVESPKEEVNDQVRGRGSFIRATEGIKSLLNAGFNPIVTATGNGNALALVEEMSRWVSSLGAEEPRVKVMPILYLGRAAESYRPYAPNERVTEGCFTNYNFPRENLQCSWCRMATSDGVYVCPILVDHPPARMGATLHGSLSPYTLDSPACYTCRVAGLCCANSPA